jgi:hypothetical protein
MKNGPGCRRFLGFASCASSRMGSFSGAVICVSAFPAGETIAPFQVSQKFIALFFTVKEFFKFFII